MVTPSSKVKTHSLIFGRLWIWGLVVVLIGVFLLWLMLRVDRHNAPASAASRVSATAAPRVDASPKTSVVAQSWDQRWSQWLLRLGTAGNDAELATEFEALIVADPARALAAALRETDAARRTSLIQAILLLWAETDPTAAAAKARALPDAERAVGVAAVLAGASGRPDVAVRLAVEFCRDDPALASGHGYALIAALGRTGEFRAAIRFALGEESAADGEDRNKWLKAAFAQWAAQNPTAAMAAIQELPGAGSRFEALESIAANRVHTDPAGLAATLRHLPPGPERSLVLGQALHVWANSDPKTAADWLNRLEPSLELDAGAAALATATQSQTLNRRPEVALSWAESIVGAELRSRTLATVVQKWAATDAASASRYVQASTDLLPEDRAALVAALNANTQAP
jgi:hypothetical protein